MSDNNTTTVGKEAEGNFSKTLLRNNKALRQDRGNKIARQTRNAYYTRIATMQEKLNDLRDSSENLLDINPSSTTSILNPNEFDQDAFVTADLETQVKMENIRIKLKAAIQRYTYLFGDINKHNVVISVDEPEVISSRNESTT